MSNFGGQNPYPGYGQQPPPQGGMGGYGQPQPQYPSAPMHGHHGQGGHAMTGPTTGPTPPPQRRGSSKALPIMVAAGLAVGVCGGLVLVLGTGSSDAATSDDTDTASAMGDQDTTATTGDQPDDATGAIAKDGDTKGEAAGAEAGETAADKPAKREVTIEFKLDPKNAKVTVDGQPVSGGTYQVELGPDETMKVEIAAAASGYESKTMDYEVKDSDTVALELAKVKKKSSATRSSSSKKSSSKKKKKKKKKKGVGGGIDLDF